MKVALVAQASRFAMAQSERIIIAVRRMVAVEQGLIALDGNVRDMVPEPKGLGHPVCSEDSSKSS